jgi:hypothetical protein
VTSAFKRAGVSERPICSWSPGLVALPRSRLLSSKLPSPVDVESRTQCSTQIIVKDLESLTIKDYRELSTRNGEWKRRHQSSNNRKPRRRTPRV